MIETVQNCPLHTKITSQPSFFAMEAANGFFGFLVHGFRELVNFSQNENSFSLTKTDYMNRLCYPKKTGMLHCFSGFCF